ncbi:MAG: glycerol-3-phosphate dehydrogenase [Myxococcales bacterium]|nr:glycerol-3-phosphate dehydrogenase [Myxococcales bacterium]
MPTRAEMWERLGSDVDVLVVGGGVTGAGVARDAARRGLTVALVEQDDLAYGTSSRSSKLVHGGLRYLESYEFGLVFESVSERRILMDLAPHLVNPLGFVFPVYAGSKHNLFIINAGMWLYDGLSLFRSPKIHKKLKPAEVAVLEPVLRQEGLEGAPLYYDCSTDDARLTLETALDAAEEGAVIATYARVTHFLEDETGRITGAAVKDRFSGEEKEIHAHAVVNATGPWTDRTLAMRRGEVADDANRGLLRPTKGVHVVVDAEKLPVQHAVVCFHPEDSRVLFAIPWGDRTYIGTTDTDYRGDPGEVAATAADVDYLLQAANTYFPQHTLVPADVISTWAGLRPLMAPPSDEHGESMNESAVSREHRIMVGVGGLVTIAGGKLTTYRRMAAEVTDTVVRLLRISGHLPEDLSDPKTDSAPLVGAVGWPEDDDHAAVAAKVRAASKDVLPEDVARHLTDSYGMRAFTLAELCAADASLAERILPGRPETFVQVDWAVHEELATSLSDVMIRRTQLYYRDHDQGLGVAEAVAERMAERLGWDGARRNEELGRYRADVARSRAWKQED